MTIEAIDKFQSHYDTQESLYQRVGLVEMIHYISAKIAKWLSVL